MNALVPVKEKLSFLFRQRKGCHLCRRMRQKKRQKFPPSWDKERSFTSECRACSRNLRSGRRGFLRFFSAGAALKKCTASHPAVHNSSPITPFCQEKIFKFSGAQKCGGRNLPCNFIPTHPQDLYSSLTACSSRRTAAATARSASSQVTFPSG